MGVRIGIFNGEEILLDQRGRVMPLLPLEHNTRMFMHQWFRTSTHRERATRRADSAHAASSCRLELAGTFTANRRQVRRPDAPRFLYRQLRGHSLHSALLCDLDSPADLCLWSGRAFSYLHPLADLAALSGRRSRRAPGAAPRIVDIDATVTGSGDNQLIQVVLTLEHACVALLTYESATLDVCSESCYWLPLPRGAGTRITGVHTLHLPYYLLVSTDRGLFCYSLGRSTWYDLGLPPGLCNRNFSYSMRGTQLLVSNGVDCIWHVEDVLATEMEVELYDFTSIFRSEEMLERVVSVQFQSFVVETNQRFMEVRAHAGDYIDFLQILMKPSKHTIAMAAPDMTRVSLIDRSQYALSLSVYIRQFNHAQTKLVAYVDLQRDSLNPSRAPIRRQIHHAQYNDAEGTVTIFHSAPLVIDTFKITPSTPDSVPTSAMRATLAQYGPPPAPVHPTSGRLAAMSARATRRDQAALDAMSAIFASPGQSTRSAQTSRSTPR
ncbi:hypothetical protein DAKH74_024910 [Maudiozyma humilis]|uniref:Uncharacterized protein n=1 Tax=Maudiozyma humilis TaxID=51915 RepID=A0AAV5RWR3_MAUHU|nr:hypothetical protein DAKH74_024910 [Kazachstania humilis]